MALQRFEFKALVAYALEIWMTATILFRGAYRPSESQSLCSVAKPTGYAISEPFFHTNHHSQSCGVVTLLVLDMMLMKICTEYSSIGTVTYTNI